MKIAIVKTGGKQYKIAEGDVLDIEKIAGNAGDKTVFNEILLFSDDNGEVTLGMPNLPVNVSGIIVKQGREDKITVIKYKRKIRYRRKLGHRQPFTQVKIDKINYDSLSTMRDPNKQNSL